MPGHRRSTRLSYYDYRNSAAYFVSACTRERAQTFGRISAGEMQLSALGELAQAELMGLAKYYCGLELDAWVVMPNHVHAVLMLLPGLSRVTIEEPKPAKVEAAQAAPVALGASSCSLGAIVGAYKSGVTRKWRLACSSPALQVWQRSYYEHVIRDDQALDRIRDYILFNPQQWSLDRENPAAVALDPIYAWLKAQGERLV